MTFDFYGNPDDVDQISQDIMVDDYTEALKEEGFTEQEASMMADMFRSEMFYG